MNHAIAIDVLAECGAVSAALEAEHDAIDGMLRTLNKVMLAGAEPTVIVRVADLLTDYCTSHFAREERFMRDHGDAGLPAHVAAHRELIERTRRVRARVISGNAAATLEAADLLEAIRNHINGFDNPAYQRILQKADPGEGEDSNRATELVRLHRMAV